MRKLIVSGFVTLDGVMQAPGGKDEDLDGGFEHVDVTPRDSCHLDDGNPEPGQVDGENASPLR
jgi:hypothetical protein